MPAKTKTTKKSSAAHTPKKRFHHHHFPMIPLGSWILFWFFVAVTILLSTVCFTKVLDTTGRYATSTATNGSLATQRTLEARVAELQTQPPKSGRVLVDVCTQTETEANISTWCKTWNHATATQSIVWQDKNTGLQAQLPYNFAWGSDTCLPTPFITKVTDKLTTVAFGPVVNIGDCIPARDASISASSSMDANVFLRDLKARNLGPDLSAIRQRTLGGIAVLSYRIDALGGGNYWEVFGRSFHYTLNSQGWLTDAEAVKIIQSLKVVK
jgi:hypothetical protein